MTDLQLADMGADIARLTATINERTEEVRTLGFSLPVSFFMDGGLDIRRIIRIVLLWRI